MVATPEDRNATAMPYVDNFQSVAIPKGVRNLGLFTCRCEIVHLLATLKVERGSWLVNWLTANLVSKRKQLHLAVRCVLQLFYMSIFSDVL